MKTGKSMRIEKRLVLTLLATILLLAGCGKKSKSEEPKEVFGDGYHITADGVIEVDDEKKEHDAKLAKEVLGIDLSGEYVVDYQLGEEPIPLEIADLGNPCVGTIHAYPSKIDAALSEMMMAEDEGLSEKADFLINEINELFANEGRNDLEYRDIRMYDNQLWFVDYYDKSIDEIREFYHPSISDKKETAQKIGSFYEGPINYRLYSEKLRYKEEKYEQKLREQNEESIVNAEYYDGRVCIIIWNLKDEIDRIEEQKNIAKYWRIIQTLKGEEDVDFQVVFVPYKYKEICEKKGEAHFFEDYWLGNSVDIYLQTGEVSDFFWYDTWKRKQYIGGHRKNGDEKIYQYTTDMSECIENIEKEWDYWY